MKFQQGTVTDLKLISKSWNKKKCRPDGYRNGYGDLMWVKGLMRISRKYLNPLTPRSNL